MNYVGAGEYTRTENDSAFTAHVLLSKCCVNVMFNVTIRLFSLPEVEDFFSIRKDFINDERSHGKPGRSYIQ